VKPEKTRGGRVLPPFLLKPSWGPEGFYLKYVGAAPASTTLSPSEKRADAYLLSVPEASHAEIMEAAEIRSRQTMLNVVAARIRAKAWERIESPSTGLAVYRHVSKASVQDVQ